MTNTRRRHAFKGPFGRGPNCPKSNCWCERREDSSGFTLVELLIVVTVTPLIVAALGAGLFAMFSLQTSVSNRLSDSGDAEVVTANFEPDVQGAQEISLAGVTNECSTQQIFGAEWGLSGGVYGDVVSYVVVQNGSQYNLVRDLCQPNPTSPSELTQVSSIVLSYNSGPSPTFQIVCTPANTATCATDENPPSGTSPTWISTQLVENVQLTIDEPSSNNSGEPYNYSLTAVPAATASVPSGGQPVNNAVSTGCGFAASGSGPLASSLCMIDFSNLLGSPSLLADAESGSCLYESVKLSSGFWLYFCLSISNSEPGEIISPTALPTWCQGFLGNPGTSAACGQTGVYPNYYDVPGNPALYQQGTGAVGDNDGYDTTITLSGIKVVNGSGTSATGWEIFSADAESTDSGCGTGCSAESITWSSNTTVTVISNGYLLANGYCTGSLPCDGTTSPWGTACDGGGSWTSGGNTYFGISSSATDEVDYYQKNAQGVFVATPDDTVECTVPPNQQNVTLTGAGMVEAITPTTFTAKLGDGPGGLEAVVFGLLTS